MLGSCNLQLANGCIPLKTNYFAIERLALRLRCDLGRRVCFQEQSMADVIFIVITVVFFIIACLYVRGCDRL